MSQMRVLFRELRAALSAAAVCALVLGLIFANFADTASANTPRTGAKAGGYELCFQHLKQLSDKQSAPVSGDEHSRQHKCPACCLAAALGAALLPERVTHATRPADRAVVIAYAAASPGEPQSLLFRAANGARAPPV